MTQKVAVAVVHGIGKQGPDFVEKIREEISKRCRPVCGEDIVIEAVHWATVLQDVEDDLWNRMIGGGPVDYRATRRLMVDFVADALAYQPTDYDRAAYDGIHAEFAATLRRLAEKTSPDAPLCIISHSLGTVITSNFIYDLQNPHLITRDVRKEMTDSPLETGATIQLLYTLGSPIALWSLRYTDFGMPITIPAPQLNDYHEGLKGEWINYYDRDDVVAFPLRSLNEAYAEAVTADKEVNAGGLLRSWNPLSHLEYWQDKDVVEPISKRLIETWRTLNEKTRPVS